MARIDESTIFSTQYQMAWDHFRFHAEQRTKVFHFFLITAALLVNAFSLITREGSIYEEHAYIVLAIGGLMSTVFLALDVRNTQLLEQSEAILRKIEEDYLYPGWHSEATGYGDVRLGILSRELALKRYLEDHGGAANRPILRWIFVHNIKHKLAIRFMELLAIASFWTFAVRATEPAFVFLFYFFDISVRTIEVILFLLCLAWSIYAMYTPRRDLQREHKAYLSVSEKSSDTPAI